MKFKAVILAVLFLLASQASGAEDYDPRYTVLALDMAIVSVQRIINTNDRIILTEEYNNIINNLKLGSIEADRELRELYQALMTTISTKILAQEEAGMLQRHYDGWETRQIAKAMFNARAYGTDPVTITASLALSCASQYIAFQNSEERERMHNALDVKLWRIEKAEREQYNALQLKLFDASWRLLRKYNIPDEYRLVQSSVNDFSRAVSEPDVKKRAGMLQSLEDEFRVYPPYWIHRARTEQELGHMVEARRCYDEFGNVWRPVLRQDVWKAEAAKYRIQDYLTRSNFFTRHRNNEAAMKELEVLRANITRMDWANNLFAGVAYFAMGNKQKAVECVETNINFGSETELSGVILSQMKLGRLSPESLPDGLKNLVGLNSMAYEELVTLAGKGYVDAMLELGVRYSTGNGVQKDYKEAMSWFQKAADKCSEFGMFAIGGLYAEGGSGINQDYREAVKWFEKVAYQGSKEAQNALANLYYKGGVNLPQNYYKAYVWCCVAEIESNFSRSDFATWGAVVGGGSAVMGVLGGLAFWPVFLPVAGLMYLVGESGIDNNIKADIEGAGIFNFSKLSNSDMERAKHEAENISRQIVENIKKRRSLQ